MKNTKIEKFISSLLIVSIMAPSIFFLAPKRADAFLGISDFSIDSIANILNYISGKGYQASDAALQTVGVGTQVTTTAYQAKTWYEEILKQVLMAVARKALQQITKSTVNWINNGFHGSPLFLENPQSFFEDIAKSQVKTLVNMFGYNSLKYPYGKDFALNAINSYKRTLENNAQYSLSTVINDPATLYNYQNNFNYGGWNGFLINTQYPQNNYLGFQMLATEELARRVQGVTQAPAQKVQSLLQQGQGFLSPQTCPTNSSYNNGYNEYNQPSFDTSAWMKSHPAPTQPDLASDTNPTAEDQLKIQAYYDRVNDWNDSKTTAESTWEQDNTCPGGLKNTTPGSVVANQITTAMGSQFRQSELGAAMGNSLSAIFDALLNKFLGEGLNALASTTNPQPASDTWSYNGLTLGGPGDTGTNSSWDSGPDEIVDINTFRKQIVGKTIVAGAAVGITNEEIGNTGRGQYIPGDIANSQEEIVLMDNVSDVNPGAIQIMKAIPLQAKTLDECIPGPKKGWEARLKDEEELNVSKFGVKEGQDNDPLKVRAGNAGIKELKFAVDSFKNWINVKKENSLPGAVNYVDAVKSIDDLHQQLTETVDARRAKSQAVLRLQTIENGLEAFPKDGTGKSIQPATGSAREKTLILLRKQYNALKSSISSTNTIEDTRNKLNTLKERLASLQNLDTRCETERSAAGWTKDREITEMCSIPIVSGYSHGTVVRNDEAVRENNCFPTPGNCNSAGWDTEGWFTFRNPNVNHNVVTPNGPVTPQPADAGNPGYQDLPLVNAKNVFGDMGGGIDWVSIEIDCKLIFKANPLDYTNAGDVTP